MAIDQQGAQPLGAQIRADLVRRIQAGEFAIGQKIPSLRALAAHYEVAELTVHNAIRELQHSGVLESASGRGTFVRRVPEVGERSTSEEIAALRAEITELRERVTALEDK
jgi:DNA-binding GntR family transcriptional regulator